MNEERKGIRLSDSQRLSWLCLIRSENVGPATFRDLIAHCGSAADALEMLPELVRHGGAGRPIRIASLADAEREMQAAARMGAIFIGIGEPDYPRYLRQCDNPPPLVAVKGNPEVFRLPPVAIVGARNASMVGIKFARTIARELGEAGYAIISGLARGIDTAAHEASLDHGTVAVMAGGLDLPYPPENLNLYRAISDRNGAAISEMPFGWEPRAKDFPRRNRIIAALSLGLVVVEAAERSGSLISARLAGELGRLVFAVPGSPLDPRAKGTNGLLKNGAIVTTCTQDIVSALTPLVERPVFDDPAFLAPETDFPAIQSSR
jgi:DNA processing protein